MPCGHSWQTTDLSTYTDENLFSGWCVALHRFARNQGDFDSWMWMWVIVLEQIRRKPRRAIPASIDHVYQCWKCKEWYEKGWSDEDAAAELADMHPGLSEADCEILCDDCYKIVAPPRPVDDVAVA